MTRKEAIKIIQRIYVPDGNGDVLGIAEGETLFGDDVEEALKMAIQALEQEPKIGHWIYDDEYSDWFSVTYECSCCKRAVFIPYELRNEVYKEYPYCHCGARMIDLQESEK